MKKENRSATVTRSGVAGVEFGVTQQDDLRYWKSRLIQRKYADLARLAPRKEYSARIEHERVGFFFPLGADDENRAAAKALKIYLTVVQHDWSTACRRFAREITVAIFWGLSPVACTYTTIFTLTHRHTAQLTPQRAAGKAVRSVAVFEPEEAVRRALIFWIDRQPGFRCATPGATWQDACRSLRAGTPDLVLVNRNLADLPGSERLETLRSLRPDLPVFSFGVYEESDWIFHSLTGVNAGYYLRRRPPLEWFDPIAEAARETEFTRASLDRHVRKYFQSLFEVSRPGEELQDLANLTRREREILVCLSQGFKDKEIADALKISVWTVHGHVKNVFEKLGVHSRTEAVVKYLQK